MLVLTFLLNGGLYHRMWFLLSLFARTLAYVGIRSHSVPTGIVDYIDQRISYLTIETTDVC